jgi:sigma-B regulation protein RsbU (phosphoserine phosphatase)
MGEQPLWARRARPPLTLDARALGHWRPTSAADITSGRRELAVAAQRSARGDAALEQLELAFEEVVSNAVRHGLPPVEATVWMSDHSWLLEVIDAAGEQAPTQAVDRDPALGGLGLGLVAALCDEVGWERLGDGRKLVWARLDLSGNGTSGRPVANGLPHRAGYGTLHRSAAGTSATGTTTAAYDRDQLAFLAEVSDTLIRTLDTGATAEHLARLAVPRLADWATVTLMEEDGRREQTARAHRDPARLADLDAYLAGRQTGARDRPALMTVLLSGNPVQVTTVDPALVRALPTDELRQTFARLDAASALFVPLQTHGEVFGALSLVRTSDRPSHTDAEVALSIEVARRGALALDNARLYTRQLTVAETLQRSLLTAPPRTAELPIAVRYRPASRHALVGGDFYDAVQLEDGATLLVVGDVAGHSVEATAAMSELRSAVRTLAYDTPSSPAQILTRADRALSGVGFGTLATVLVGRIERPGQERTAGRTLRWSSAGHPPGLLLHADGRVEVLDGRPERLIGAGGAAVRSDHETTLGPGDTVVFYTDGLLEHGRTLIDDGLARLTAALGDLVGQPLEQLCDLLLDRIITGRADDDVALLAVRYEPSDVERPTSPGAQSCQRSQASS